MMSFLDFFFCKLYQYFGKEYGVLTPVVSIIGVLIFNLMTIILLLSSFGLFEMLNTDIHRSTIFRFILGPLVVVVISIPLYNYFKNNNRYEKLNLNYISMSGDNKKYLNKRFYTYIIVSIIALFTSVVSPIFWQ